MGSGQVTSSVPSEFTGKHVTVAGLGVSGVPAAKVLHGLGAHVTVVNDGDDERSRAQAAQLEALGVTVRLGDGDTLPEGTELIVTAPGWKPTKPLFTAAEEARCPGLGRRGAGLAAARPRRPGTRALAGGHRHQRQDHHRPDARLDPEGGRAAHRSRRQHRRLPAGRGHRRGGVRRPRRGAVQLPAPLGALPARPLRRRAQPRPGPPRLARLDGGPYAADKGRIYEGNLVACVYNVADKATEDLVRAADVEEGCRAIGFTLGTPGPSQLGVVEGLLVDRAFVEDRHKNAQELAEVSDVNPPAPHNIANALAAAGLARAFGVSAAAVRDGLRAFTPDAHRIAHVADVDGVSYVDDSKATNTHATEASLAAYESIVWIAGGLAKGATFDELVAGAAKRLRGAVLIGADRALIREALARHAPEVPVVDLDRTDTGAMLQAVQEARRLARPGDTVLLAPACASMDMFTNYNQRGDAFAQAVRELGA
ncbi:UDP-N-acetylmuramoylalanine--D-glutamate ligase [Streptomyces ambofaciens]